MAKQRIKRDYCPNCNQALKTEDEFCPNCGQENHDINRPFKYLFWEILEGAFNLDSRAWTSFLTIIRYPGKFALAFNAGRRKSFVPPVRFFLLSNIIFFLILSFDPFEQDQLNKVNMDLLFQGKDTIPINLVNTRIPLSKEEYLALNDFSESQIDSLLVSKSIEPSFYKRKILRALPRTLGNLKAFQQKMYKNLSFAVFFMIPIFAFLLHLMYLRQKKFYVEHLILAINYHAFFFLMSSFLVVIRWFAFAYLVSLVSFCIAFGYLVFALKRFYQQAWGKTLVKSFLLFFSYSIISFFVLIIASLLAMILF